MKCPCCGSKGARVDGTSIRSGECIHEAIDCPNPSCIAYDPITYGDHPDMHPVPRQQYDRYMQMIRREADFDPIFFRK